MIEKRVLGAEESKEYSISSTEPLQVGVRVPIDSSVDDELSFRIDPEDNFAPQIAGRIVEIDSSKKVFDGCRIEDGRRVVYHACRWKIQFKTESRKR